MPAQPLTPDQKADADRLKKLFSRWQAERRARGESASQEHIGELLGLTQSGLSQYLNGRIPLNVAIVAKLASLMGRQPEEISAAVAEEIRALGAFADTAHISAPTEPTKTGQNEALFEGMGSAGAPMIHSHDIKPGPQIQGKLPLITWAQARNWEQLVNTFTQKDASDWLDCPVPHSPKSFCVENNGDAMDDGTASGYREGEILFVDPEVGAVPGKDVIIQLSDGTLLFRRLKEDSEGVYLLSLNGKKITRMPQGASPIGVVIFSGVRR